MHTKNSSRILLMADYLGGYEIAKYLITKKENIVGLVVRSDKDTNYLNYKYKKLILNLININKKNIFDWDNFNNVKNLNKIKNLKPDYILTIMCCGILKPEIINIAKIGCINLHLSYLPYCRGKNPNVWAIMHKKPAGVTIHWIDKNIDTGDIIAQKKINVNSTDTAKTLYYKCEKNASKLFIKTWDKIKNNKIKSIKQINKSATFNLAKDFEKLSSIDLEKKYLAEDLINLLRAKTFPPFQGTYFIDKFGRKVQIRVKLNFIK